MRAIVYTALGEIHNYLSNKINTQIKQLKYMGVGPFCKIKINKELKLKLEGKELIFLVFFSILRFNRKRIN